MAPLVAGHIVRVGTSAAGLLDIRTTALGGTVPGVSIHAQAMEQMLLGDHLSRPDVTAGLELAAFLGLAAAVTRSIALAGPGLAVGLAAFGAAGLLAASWAAFGRGKLFDAAFPTIAAWLAGALHQGLAGFHGALPARAADYRPTPPDMGALL